MKPRYWRTRNLTGELDRDTGKVLPKSTQQHKSINAAKRHSRELQGKELGQGSLIVIRR